MSLYSMYICIVFLLVLKNVVFGAEIFNVVADFWDISSEGGITFIQKFKKKNLEGSGTFYGLLEFEKNCESPFF